MNVNRTIADNFKKIRDARKMSLDTVSRLSGVSKSMLGQIERGEVNPTISVLWKIAIGLKISFTSFLERETEATEIVREKEIMPMVECGGLFINHPIFSFDEERRFEIYRIGMLPECTFESSAHLIGTEEYITVFTGEAIVIIDGREELLRKGDSIRFKADVAHGYRNDGDVSVEMSMILYYPR
jgi:transcriptional regulator with XRE-family HTH domain